MLDTVPLGSLSLASAPASASPPTLSSPLDIDSTATTPEQAPQPLPPRATSSPLGSGDIEHASTEELVARCLEFSERMRKRVTPWVAQRMDMAYGPMPEDSAQLSYWMALVSSRDLPKPHDERVAY
jgi:hypothetical protein